ncbi:MAG: nitroreductase family protein [Coriobacteriia bacterium]|nr:nitroreductase family protein [Coriobacteriia bacterium]
MLDVIKNRRSVRSYLDKEVSEEDITALVESARLAPSANNMQPTRFIIVRSLETKAALVAVDHNQQWMLQAPVIIVAVADPSGWNDRPLGQYEEGTPSDEQTPGLYLKYIIRDAAIAIENLILEAEGRGLSSCWTGWFSQADVRPLLAIPADKYVCGIITVGYSDSRSQPRPRKDLAEILMYEKWSE